MRRGRLSFYSVLFIISIFLVNLIIAQGAPVGLLQQAQPTDQQPATTNTNGETVGQVFFSFLSENIIKVFQTGPISIPNLSRILLGVLLWMVLYSVVSQIGLFQNQQSTVLFPAVIALIFTILTFIYLPAEFFAAIATPYASVGATILTFLPFGIIVYFTVWVTDSLILARTIWIVFGAYYFILLMYQIALLPTNYTNDSSILSQAIWAALPYLIMMVIGGFIFWQLRNVRLWVFQSKIEEAEEKGGRLVRKAGAGARTLAGAADELGRGQGRRR